jgi:signal peptidase II
LIFNISYLAFKSKDKIKLNLQIKKPIAELIFYTNFAAMKNKRLFWSLGIVFGILFFDQWSKIYVKTHFLLGEGIVVFPNWFQIVFVENPGMAFGLELEGNYGKLALSLFRIVAIGFIGFYLVKIVKSTLTHWSMIVGWSLIFAGAIGNIIDSAFYGMIFNESHYQLAELFPVSGGYSSFLHGNVVDMLHFPLFQGHFPSWFPIWGSERFEFFSPVFNIADSAITTGVVFLFIFQKHFFSAPQLSSEQEKPSNL